MHWAIISLSLFAGAFNVEIFRSGIEAVPQTTVEAAEALGYTRLKAYLHIVLPLAFRICLPALNNNLVNLLKTTTLAYAIAVPGDALRGQADLVRLAERPGDDDRAAGRPTSSWSACWSGSCTAGSARCAIPGFGR